jgi:hypothetical protein
MRNFNTPNSELLVLLFFFLLSGCGSPTIATDKPFQDIRASITPGKTTLEDVHKLMGDPARSITTGKAEISAAGCSGTWNDIKTCMQRRAHTKKRWEFYKTSGAGIGFFAIVPVPSGPVYHYALIVYDEAGRVSAADWGYDFGVSAWNRTALFAGPYGYYVGTDTIFPSIDAGGEADKAFAQYLSYSAWYREAGGTRKETARTAALKWVCRAAELGHSAALTEIGNYFWAEPYDFDRDGVEEGYNFDAAKLWSTFRKDNVKACVWYSAANDRILPAWCHDILSADEAAEVKNLLEHWTPNQCESDLAR